VGGGAFLQVLGAARSGVPGQGCAGELPIGTRGTASSDHLLRAVALSAASQLSAGAGESALATRSEFQPRRRAPIRPRSRSIGGLDRCERWLGTAAAPSRLQRTGGPAGGATLRLARLRTGQPRDCARGWTARRGAPEGRAIEAAPPGTCRLGARGVPCGACVDTTRCLAMHSATSPGCVAALRRRRRRHRRRQGRPPRTPVPASGRAMPAVRARQAPTAATLRTAPTTEASARDIRTIPGGRPLAANLRAAAAVCTVGDSSANPPRRDGAIGPRAGRCGWRGPICNECMYRASSGFLPLRQSGTSSRSGGTCVVHTHGLYIHTRAGAVDRRSKNSPLQ